MESYLAATLIVLCLLGYLGINLLIETQIKEEEEEDEHDL